MYFKENWQCMAEKGPLFGPVVGFKTGSKGLIIQTDPGGVYASRVPFFCGGGYAPCRFI